MCCEALGHSRLVYPLSVYTHALTPCLSWPTGQDPFRDLMPQYARRSASAIVMCDVTRQATMYEGAKEWKKSVDTSVYLPNGQPIPCILLVNKVRVINKVMKANCQWNMGDGKLTVVHTMIESCFRPTGEEYCRFCLASNIRSMRSGLFFDGNLRHLPTTIDFSNTAEHSKWSKNDSILRALAPYWGA